MSDATHFVWHIKSEDMDTGEKTGGQYFLAFMSREEIAALFLKLYKGNPKYRNHRMAVEVEGPFSEDEAKARGMLDMGLVQI